MRINLIIRRVYAFLNSFPLTKGYISKLSYRFRLIHPCDSGTIAVKSVFSCLASWVLSAAAFLVIYTAKRGLINLITAGAAIYIINSEIVGCMCKKFEIKMLMETERLFEDVIHFYYMDYRIDNALYRAREHLCNDMKAAVDQIYELLLSPDKEESLREYYDNIPNKYLRAFVGRCVWVMERGDKEHEGSLLFVKNLENLQREINIETDKLQRMEMEFMGVILCVTAPVFCIDVVKRFAISLKEDMEVFYYGSRGFLLDLGLIAVILGIYVIMRKSAEYKAFHLSSHRWLYKMDSIGIIKRAMDNYCDKYASRVECLQRRLRDGGISLRARHFILRSYILALAMFLVSAGISVYLHVCSNNQAASADGAAYKLMASFAESIYFSFPDLLASLCIGAAAYYLPFVLLSFGSSVSRDAMEDEVNQFNAIIGMLMYNETITVKQILTEMESFALIFRQSIRMCIDDFSSGDIEALNELREREPYEPFRRIVDNLIRCDAMPVHQAFAEINLNQEGYMARRKLMNEKSIRRRVFRAYVLAALPFMLLFAYGLLPALVSSVRELNMLIEEIENMAW